MRIYLDFDDTLFDCNIRFKHVLFSCISKYTHHTHQQVELAYQHLHDPLYTLEKHLIALGCNSTNTRLQAQHIKTELASHLSGMILPEANKFLQQVDKKAHELILITHGDPEYQNWKLTNSGLAHYFNQTYFVSTLKGAYLLSNNLEKRESQFVFVDDKVDQQNDVQIHFPYSKVQGNFLGLLDWLNSQQQTHNHA